MSGTRPLIGITSRHMNYKLESWMVPQQGVIETMIDAVVAAGGAPVLIPLTDDQAALHSIYSSLDGVLIAGGGDVNPRHYGEEIKEDLLNPDDLLDKVDIALAQWAVQDEKPLFGVCRGSQVINVALGGSLFQDTGKATGTVIEHNESWLRHQYDVLIHDITLTAQSRLAASLGTTQLKVNSLHHQSVNRLAEGLEVVAVAPDGVVEAYEGDGETYILGVQCHPEALIAHDPRWNGVYKDFVSAAHRFAITKQPA